MNSYFKCCLASALLQFLLFSLAANASSCGKQFEGVSDVKVVRLPDGFKANELEEGYWQLLAENAPLLGQTDPRLLKEGLITKNDSALCGPIAMMTGMASLRKGIFGKNPNPAQLTESLLDLNRELARKFRIKMLPDGLMADDLAKATRLYNRSLGGALKLNVSSKDFLMNTKRILPRDILDSKPLEMKLISVSVFKEKSSYPISKHFLLRVAVSDNGEKIIFMDPYQPSKPISAALVRSTLPGTTSDTAELVLDQPFSSLPGGRVLVDSMVSAKFSR